MDSIGTRIKLIRSRNNLKQIEFGSLLGIKQGYVTNLESGRATPSEQLIKAISLQFGIREEWLFTGEEPMYQPAEEAAEEILDRYGVDFIRIALEKAKARGLYGDLQPKDIIPVEDIELNQIICYLTDTWKNGDQRIKNWLSIQFEKSFPEFKEYLQKNRLQTAKRTGNGA
ncbi:helix-turn-helix transcriptional regulator [Desulforamulus ruminis]|uniref:helix-turn-helix domain-containing protein n=1 Tax=Desulforamulus ruminis TaxID=1564 RepID=UPI002FDB230C